MIIENRLATIFMNLEKEEYILIKGINAGEEQALEALFHKYYAALCYFANKFLHDSETAKDVVQEVFIRFCEKKVDFPNITALKSYLYECVQHKALNYLEKENIHSAIHQKLEQNESVENEFLYPQIESEIFEEIFSAINELPTECRRIFQMSYLENMSIQEISKILNISETTIKTQRYRAKKYLQKRLQNLFSIVVFLFF